MANFAKLTEDAYVVDVVVVNNEVMKDSQGQEREELGIAFLVETFKYPYWKQTSYNGSFRKNYAGIGYRYDSVLDAFIPPKPYFSWLLNTDTCQWQAPVPYPTDGAFYVWDEQKQEWIYSAPQ
jgi:hypothetical protein